MVASSTNIGNLVVLYNFLINILGRIGDIENGEILPCVHCDNGKCNGVVQCSYSYDFPSYCYIIWNRKNSAESIVKGGCYSTSGEICESSCVAYQPINYQGRGEENNEKHIENKDTSYDYFCCCNQSLCNANFSFDANHIRYKRHPFSSNDPKNIFNSLYITAGLLILIVAIISILIFVVKERKHKKYRDHLSIPFLRRKSTSSKKYLILRMPKARLDDVISRATATTIYKATLLKLSYPVAVKVYNSHDVEGWNRECNIYLNYKILHDNILSCKGAGLAKTGKKMGPGFIVPDNSLYCLKKKSMFNFLLMIDYHPTGSLDGFLLNNLIGVSDVIRIITDICRGLEYLHSSSCRSTAFKPVIVHRDIKASNILIKNDGTCCIADFGLAIDLDDDLHCGKISQVGTVRYMAPEILDGCISYRRDVLPMIDVYALGLVIWEVLTRCKDSEGSLSFFIQEYNQIFERAYFKELGSSPTKEMVHYFVVNCKSRP
ncbi:hypothetical protein MXB_1845, partial [Myxobolus squamalis]